MCYSSAGFVHSGCSSINADITDSRLPQMETMGCSRAFPESFVSFIKPHWQPPPNHLDFSKFCNALLIQPNCDYLWSESSRHIVGRGRGSITSRLKHHHKTNRQTILHTLIWLPHWAAAGKTTRSEPFCPFLLSHNDAYCCDAMVSIWFLFQMKSQRPLLSSSTALLEFSGK